MAESSGSSLSRDDRKWLSDSPGRNWLSLLASYAGPCRGKLLLSVLFAILNVAGAFAPFLCLYAVLSSYAEGTLTPQSALWLCFLAALSFFVSVVSRGISTVLSHISAYSILEGMRNKMIDRLSKAPLGVVMSRPSGQYKDTVVDRVEIIERPLAHLIPEFISASLLPICVICALVAVDWRIAVASLASIVLGMIPMAMATKNYNSQYVAYMEANARVNNVIVEYVEGIEVVKAFNQSTDSYEKFVREITSFKDFTLAWFKDTWVLTSLSMSIVPTTLLGVLPVGIALYLSGSLTAAEFALCAVLSLVLIEPLLKVSFLQNEMKSMEYAVNDANELLNLPELCEAKDPKTPSSFGLSFEDVSFSYSGDSSDDVLHEVSFDVAEGSSVAIVGPSGGGKTTIARLISRFWDVTGGSVKIGGVDVRDMSLDALARTVSFVTQDNFLFDCSLRENIRLGNPSASDEEVELAAEAAQCGEFVGRLEKGWDTPAGEAGSMLSGGERQRIALARAFLKNAPIVVLDEATAFTDPESESKIQSSLKRLAKGKTLVVIAHRLSTISNSDQIIVVEEGNVVATGTHERLLKDCPLYLSMWESHVGARKWAVGATAEGGLR